MMESMDLFDDEQSQRHLQQQSNTNAFNLYKQGTTGRQVNSARAGNGL